MTLKIFHDKIFNGLSTGWVDRGSGSENIFVVILMLSESLYEILAARS